MLQKGSKGQIDKKKEWNCQKSGKVQCPLKGKCQHRGNSVVYLTTSTTETGVVKKYTGATEDFKKDGNTKISSRRNTTALIWVMKDQGLNKEVEWEFLKL